jgi:hypothetical protein
VKRDGRSSSSVDKSGKRFDEAWALIAARGPGLYAALAAIQSRVIRRDRHLWLRMPAFARLEAQSAISAEEGRSHLG